MKSRDILEEWLLSHEEDIALEINDFGELLAVFEELIGRKPKERVFHDAMQG